jgi:RNA 2',3'-cyclic 3'-phosphodiesterase
MIYRLFIAADLPQAVKAALVAAQEHLRQGRPPIRWAAPDAMHLTLRFLGDTSSDRIPAIEQAMRGALAGRAAMTLQLSAIGAFPTPMRPSVIWAGVGGATGALERVQVDLEAGLAAIGIARETRSFHPHLTLGRVRRDVDAAALEQVRAALRQAPALPPIAWPVERIVLFRSELRREGSIYTEIVDCRLQIAD